MKILVTGPRGCFPVQEIEVYMGTEYCIDEFCIDRLTQGQGIRLYPLKHSSD